MSDAKTSRPKIPWSTLAIEAIVVVASVLLALAVNSWREGRSEHQLAVRALQGLVDEINVNCALILSIHPYHQAVAEQGRQPEGLRIGMLRNDAWQSAQSTGVAAHVDYEVAAIAGQVYANQLDHRTFVQSYAQALFIALGSGVTLDDLHGDLDIAVIREIVRIQERLKGSYNELRAALHTNYEQIEANRVCEDA